MNVIKAETDKVFWFDFYTNDSSGVRVPALLAGIKIVRDSMESESLLGISRIGCNMNYRGLGVHLCVGKIDESGDYIIEIEYLQRKWGKERLKGYFLLLVR